MQTHLQDVRVGVLDEAFAKGPFLYASSRERLSQGLATQGLWCRLTHTRVYITPTAWANDKSCMQQRKADALPDV